jgi:histone deacetylase HOS2
VLPRHSKDSQVEGNSSTRRSPPEYRTRWPVEIPSTFSHFGTNDPVLPPTAMGFPGARPSNAGNNIVQEYLSPNDAYDVEDFSAFKSLTDAEKIEVIAREAEEHGLEKPLGWNVSFHYNPHVEYHHFGSSHPMKPWRLTLTKQLVVAYGLEYTMDLYTPRPANFDEIALFHDREYLSYLSK